MGMHFPAPRVVRLTDDRPQTIVNMMREQVTAQTSLVMIVLPQNRKDRYDAIKKHCCINSPVASQVILGKTIAGESKKLVVSSTLFSFQCPFNRNHLNA